MTLNTNVPLSEILAKAATALDIPDHVYEDATLKYEDIGSWLAADDSELKSYTPEVYPQGSFRLGTVVRPVCDEDDYDIDLVCYLTLDKEQTTQKNLKEIVGNRLKKRDDLAEILESMRRCWRLNYPAQDAMPHFHLDILPSIPNRERPPTGILLTDTDLLWWQKSNPKAYADWFYERMKVRFVEKRTELAESFKASIEEVPDWQVKTPLQIAVQILKRHRDIYFQEDPDNRPVSIIITTLAAQAYNNQANIYDALLDIVRDMPSKIENRDGKWWVANPADPDENFADKWNEYPKRREAFFRWLDKVQADFVKVSQQPTSSRVIEALRPMLGQRVLGSVAADLGLKMASSVPPPVTSRIQVPELGNTRHLLAPIWPVQVHYKANVSGSVYGKKPGRKLWALVDRSVPKDVWLKFTVKTNAPSPYEVRWQVVNTGKEAADAGQLRGDFYDSNDNVRWESTCYRGTHWVEAFIIKNGICVARSNRKIVKVR